MTTVKDWKDLLQNKLLQRRRVSYEERRQHPGYSYCRRCLRPWSNTKHHDIDLGDGKGCFFCCEDCWEEMTTEFKLLYAQLGAFTYWPADEVERCWPRIHQAILDGE